MHAVICQKCGAGVPPPGLHRGVTCIYCKSMHDAPEVGLAAREDGLLSGACEEAARITMTNEAVLALLRQHFTGAESTSLYPSIAGKRELGARAAHARHLPSEERVLVLYDDTIFESGDDGFLVTSRRLCWRNAGDRPRMIEWEQVDPDRMYADKRRLVLGPHAIEITGDGSIIEACEQAFHVLALSARTPSTDVARSGFALVHAADSSAAFPSATSASGRPMTQPMPERPSARPTLRPSHPPTLQSAVSPSLREPRRTANATPPPPHAVSYDSYVVHAHAQRGPAFACWCCSTPLYWNTPQCSRCNALPTPQGWRRTA